MSTPDRTSHEGPPLRAHQVALLDAVMAAPRPSKLLVNWATGSGKTRVAIEAVRALLLREPRSTVLVLVTSATEQDFIWQALEDAGLAPEKMNRFAFRALQDTATDLRPAWSSGKPYVLTMSFTGEQDVLASLCEAGWDFVVAMERPFPERASSEMIRQVVAASPQARVLIFTSQFSNYSDVGGTIISDEMEMGVLPATTFVAVGVEPGPHEIQLGLEVLSLTKLLDASNLPDANRLSDRIARKAQSSQSALEDSLRRMRSDLSHGADFSFESEVESSGNSPGSSKNQRLSADEPTAPLLRARVDACLTQLDALVEDAKLTAVQDLVRNLMSRDDVATSICIYTSYRASTFYLQEALTGISAPVYAVHRGMSSRELVDNLQAFSSMPGVLIATPSVLQGVEIANATDLIMYDLPASREALLVALSRVRPHSSLVAAGNYVFLPNRAFGPIPRVEYSISEMNKLRSQWI